MVFCIFMGRSRYRVLKHGVGVKWDPRRTAAYVPSHFMVLNPIFCYVSPKIVIFHELLIVETRNKCHWIQHAFPVKINPKYVPLKQFWTLNMHFCSQNQQNVKFLPEIVIFQEPLITETWNLQHWIQHATNPKYVNTQAILMHFSQSKATKCEILAVSLTPPDKKLKKCQFTQGKSFCKGLQICTYRLFSMPMTMHYVRTLCDKYFLSYYGFLHFYGKV